jgi:hypothetical protein
VSRVATFRGTLAPSVQRAVVIIDARDAQFVRYFAWAQKACQYNVQVGATRDGLFAPISFSGLFLSAGQKASSTIEGGAWIRIDYDPGSTTDPNNVEFTLLVPELR